MSNRLKIFLLLACIIMAVTSTVYSLPSGGRTISYYDDENLTNIVGERDLECGSGQWWEWGTRTRFYRTEGWSCGDALTYTCTETLCMGYVGGDPNSVDSYTCETFSCDHW